MITVAAALEMVLQQSRANPAVDVPLEDALGLDLAADVLADLDSPPFDKALVDGYAVALADLTTLPARLPSVGTVSAGDDASLPLPPGSTVRIMTGGVVPPGADAVVMWEKVATHPADGGKDAAVEFSAAPRLGEGILRRGASAAAGSRVLPEGLRLTPVHVGVLAEAGQEEVRVVRRPTVALLATGAELVPPGERPKAGQIRNSNAAMLAACVRQAGSEVLWKRTAGDSLEEIAAALRDGRAADLVIATGGVSAGDKDFVPAAMAAAGYEKVFHKVDLRPGKPLWFGVAETGERRILAFGLPGNPLSTLACFGLFVHPALRRLAGDADPRPRPRKAALAHDFAVEAERETYYPVRLFRTPAGEAVEVHSWQGSADLYGTARANAFARIRHGSHRFFQGEALEVFPWSDWV